jgi:hypothetical protein
VHKTTVWAVICVWNICRLGDRLFWFALVLIAIGAIKMFVG